jgi:hypothetical protein
VKTPPRIPPAAVSELAALALLTLRAAALPLSQGWRDWIVVIGVLWFAAGFKFRAWPLFLTACMALLWGVYLTGQVGISVAWLEHRH